MKKIFYCILCLSMIFTCFCMKNDVTAYTSSDANSVRDYVTANVINPVSNSYHVTTGTTGDGGPEFAFDNKMDTHWHTKYNSGETSTNKLVGSFERSSILEKIPSFSELKDKRIYIGGSFEQLETIKGFIYRSRNNGSEIDAFEQWALFTTTVDNPSDEDFVLTAKGSFALKKGFNHIFKFKSSVEAKHFRLVAISFPNGRQVTASEIKFIKNDSHIAAKYYYDFETVEGTVVKDKQGNRDGNLQGSATTVQGICGNALSVTTPLESLKFDGLSGLNTNWTVSYWVKPTTDFNKKICELMDANQYYAFSVRMDTSRESGFRVGPNSGDVLTMSYNFVKNNWYNLTWTQDRNVGISMYVNGKLVSTNSWTKNKNINAPIDIIGGVGFIGLIDEVKVFDSVLTYEQIQENLELDHKKHNLAFGKTAVALYEGGDVDGQSAINSGHVASNAVDGEFIDKEDQTDVRTNGNANIKSYLQVDLGHVYELSSIKLYRYFDYSYKNTVIVVSPDGNFDRENGNWTVVYNQDKENHFGFGEGTAERYTETSEGKEFEFDSVAARYVRVYTKGCDRVTNSHIVELQVFGKEKEVSYLTADNGMLRESDYNTSLEVVPFKSGSLTKHVNPTVLSVKAQTEKGLNTRNEEVVNARFVSSVPSQNLDNLRFKIEILYTDGSVRTGYVNTNKVYHEIASAQDNQVYFNKPDEVFGTSASKYFFVSKLNNIPVKDENLKIRVTPYWLPVGAVDAEYNYVEGISRTFTVKDLIEKAD